MNRASARRTTDADVAAAFREASRAAVPSGCGFRVDEQVVYPAHGVGRVVRVGEEELGGQSVTMISLAFADSAMTVRIPAATVLRTGLRKLATPGELDAALGQLKGRRRISKAIWVKRAEEYQAKINSGDLGALVGVVRDLQAAPDGPGPSFSQRNLFNVAIDRLAAEVAAVRGVEKGAALESLEGILGEAVAAA